MLAALKFDTVMKRVFGSSNDRRLKGYRPQVAAMLLRELGVLVPVSLGIGLAATLAVSRLLGTLLYGVAPRDLTTLALSACLLAAVALIAAWLPARRASRLDPMNALRQE